MINHASGILIGFNWFEGTQRPQALGQQLSTSIYSIIFGHELA